MNNISDLIAELQKIMAERGDLPVVTDEYGGSDYVLREAVCNVRDGDRRADQKPIVIIGGGPAY